MRLKPGASHDRIEGVLALPGGESVMKVEVRAAPQDGRANKALIALLAEEWRLPKSSMSLVSGASARNKTLLIAGDRERLLARMDQWVKATHG